MERVLRERFRFSAAVIGQLRGGSVVVWTVPAEEPEIVAGGAVRIPDDKERFFRWIQ